MTQAEQFEHDIRLEAELRQAALEAPVLGRLYSEAETQPSPWRDLNPVLADGE